ncbi:phage/plasmid primase, P4 family [Pseudomonas sp. LB3P81]
MTRDAMITAYIAAGLALVSIPHGKKGPTDRGWNLPENVIRTCEQAAARIDGSSNLGLMHAYSDPPTCAIDIDDMAEARQWLAARGVDLDALLSAPEAVRINSGREGRGKLLYRLNAPLPQKKAKVGKKDIIDFRCGTEGDLTVQDVLPPSVHPDTGRPYELEGDIGAIPPIPAKLLACWQGLLTTGKQVSKPADAPCSDDLPERFVELLAGDAALQKRWSGIIEGLEDPSRNGLDMSLTSLAVKRGFNDAEITVIHHAFPHGKVSQDGRGDDYISPMIAKARANRTLSRTEPWLTAHRLIAEWFTTDDGTRLLRYWNGDAYAWCDGAYRMREKADMTARIWDYLGSARHYVNTKKTASFGVNRARAGDVLGALENAAHLDSSISNPSWIGGADHPDICAGADPKDLLVLADGILHMPTRELFPHTAALFTTMALPYVYAPKAEPKQWLAFLKSLYGDDVEAIETLQEFFGYCLTTDCSQQKILLVVGPKRAGKGTIAKVLRGLIGDANCVGPTLASLSTQFGLEPLIGKRLAIFSDVRISGHIDQKHLADRVLSISGEDALSIPRKYKSDWTGALKTRLLMFSNELPKILDDSSALSSRFIILRLTKTFYGVEDTGLADRLLLELPAILNWSLDGLERLNKRGYFQQPASAMELVKELEKLTSPISAFIEDECVVDPAAQVMCEWLYSFYKIHCQREGWQYAPSAASFGASLRAALPQLERKRLGPKGNQHWVYTGVGLAGAAPAATTKPHVDKFFEGHQLPVKGGPAKSSTAAETAEIVDLDAVRAKNRAELL